MTTCIHDGYYYWTDIDAYARGQLLSFDKFNEALKHYRLYELDSGIRIHIMYKQLLTHCLLKSQGIIIIFPWK